MYTTDEENSPAYFVKCASLLAPVFMAVHCRFKEMCLDQFAEQFGQDLEWATSKQVLMDKKVDMQCLDCFMPTAPVLKICFSNCLSVFFCIFF